SHAVFIGQREGGTGEVHADSNDDLRDVIAHGRAVDQHPCHLVVSGSIMQIVRRRPRKLVSRNTSEPRALPANAFHDSTWQIDKHGHGERAAHGDADEQCITWRVVPDPPLSPTPFWLPIGTHDYPVIFLGS